MASSNLIPTPIVDKNGVSSIRYKRPEATGASQSAAMPAPALSTGNSAHSDTVAVLSNALMELRKDKEMGSRFADYGLLVKRLEGYPEETLNIFKDTIEYKSQSDYNFYETTLVSCLQNDLDGDSASYVLAIVKHCEYQGDWSYQHSADFSYVDAVRLYRGLQSVNEEYYLGLTPNLHSSRENRRRFNALLNLSVHLYNDSLTGDIEQNEVINWVSGHGEDGRGVVDWDAGWVLKSKLMLSHTAKHPEAASLFIRWYEDRGIVDDGVLEQMMESEAPALNDGLL